MPAVARAVNRRPPNFVPGQQLEPGFDDVPTLSTHTRWFACAHLPSAHLTGTSRLFRNAHHLGHWAKAASGGLDPDPVTRVREAGPHLLCSKAAPACSIHEHSFAPSWRTIVGIDLTEFGDVDAHHCIAHVLLELLNSVHNGWVIGWSRGPANTTPAQAQEKRTGAMSFFICRISRFGFAELGSLDRSLGSGRCASPDRLLQPDGHSSHE